MTAMAGVFQAFRARLGAPAASPKPRTKPLPTPSGGRARQAVADAIPVREWISVDRGQPARLLGFDRTWSASSSPCWHSAW